jgi:malonyl CoA-acyl carrier protein transacylase
MAAYHLLAALGVRPDEVAGHSYGELVALCAAGAYDEAALLELSSARAEAILRAAGALPGDSGGGDSSGADLSAPGAADAGAMAAVSATLAEVRAVFGAGGFDLGGGLVVANHNAPRQTVVSGPTPAVDRAVERLREAGISAKRIPVACAFHSPLVAGAADGLAAALAGVEVRAPRVRVWSNTTAAPYPVDPDILRATLAGQVGAPVRFVEQIEAMYAAGVRTFVEAGPGTVLTDLVGAVLGTRPHVAVNLDRPGVHGVTGMLTAAARLAAAGVPIDVGMLFTGRHARTLTVDDLPRRPGWLVDGALVRTAAGRPVHGGLQPADASEVLPAPGSRAVSPTLPYQPASPVSPVLPVLPHQIRPEEPFRPAFPAAAGPVPAQRAGGGAAEEAVLEFLRTTRELVAAQRDVVLGYLAVAGQSGGVSGGPGVPGGPDRASLLPVSAQPPDHAGFGEEEPVSTVDAAAVSDAVVGVIGERTGYPVEMLDPDLDLEADLGIDSIKRAEVLGELAQRLGLAGAGGPGELGESVVEELARVKTISGIVDWVVDWVTGRATPGAGPALPAGSRGHIDGRPAPVSVPGAAPTDAGPRLGRGGRGDRGADRLPGGDVGSGSGPRGRPGHRFDQACRGAGGVGAAAGPGRRRRAG